MSKQDGTSRTCCEMCGVWLGSPAAAYGVVVRLLPAWELQSVESLELCRGCFEDVQKIVHKIMGRRGKKDEDCDERTD